MRFYMQLVLKTEFGDYKGEQKAVTQDQFDTVTSLSKSFYNESGFEMTLEDGSFIVVPPDLIKRSILVVTKGDFI